jgi:Ca2+-transporting ATPase
MIAALTLCAFLIGQKTSVALGQTMAFAVLSGTQIFHSFNLRSNVYSLFGKGPGNKWLLYAGGASLLLQLAVLVIPFLRDIFRLVAMAPAQWLMVAGLCVAPILVVELFKALGWTGEKMQRKH